MNTLLRNSWLGRWKGLIVLLTSLFLTACSDYPLTQDLRAYPQDMNVYVSKGKADAPALSSAQQSRFVSVFLKQYYAPWDDSLAGKIVLAAKTEQWELARGLITAPGIGENQIPYTLAWSRGLIANMNLNGYPSVNRSGVTVAVTTLRLVPSNLPSYSSLDKAGEGYPFDNWQEQTLAANLPLRILHRSHDGLWYLVKSSADLGWIPSRDAALVDTTFMNDFKRAPLVVAIKDHQSLFNESHVLLQESRIGTIYPLRGATVDGYAIAVATLAPNGFAQLQTSNITNAVATSFPFSFTPAHVARVANNMLGDPYGWGGLYGYRDCSATLMDLYTPFGIWLPRVSGDQKNFGDFTPLQQFNEAKKQEYIIRHGLPLLTLLHKPGHIMLYIGTYNHTAMVFHDAWGLHTKSLLGKEGRAILGGTVITPVTLGQGHANIPNDLLAQIDGMNILNSNAEVQ